MRVIPGQPLRVFLSTAVLIVAAALLGTFRPVLRFHGQRPGRSGVYQPLPPAEISESSADDHRPTARSWALADQHVWAALLALHVRVAARVLKARQAAFVPIAIRRLKLPRAAADSSPSS